MAPPPHRYNRDHPYEHRDHYQRRDNNNGYRGGRQNDYHHGGRGRGGQGWNRNNSYHRQNTDYGQYGPLRDTKHRRNDDVENRDRYGPTRNNDSQYRHLEVRHNDNDDARGYSRLPERHNGDDMAEPPVETFVPLKLEDDDRKPLAENAAKPDIPFDDMTYEQKLIAQIPESEEKENFKRNLPLDAFLPKPYMEERKKAIVEKMVSAFRKEQEERKKPIQDDEEDDHEEEWEQREYEKILDEGGKSHWRIDDETTRVERFLRSLPSCLLLTVGFDVSGQVDVNLRCFCPCGDKMKRWREQTNCQFIDNDACSNAKNKGVFDNPNNLVAHLRSKGNSGTHRLHGRVLEYLEKLYMNYWPKSGLSHKGLYIKGDGDYEEAEKEEKRQYQSKIHHLKLELEASLAREAEQRKMQDNIKVLETVSPDLAQKLKARDYIRACLGVSSDSPNDSLQPSLDNMLPRYEAQMKKFWKHEKENFGSSHEKTHYRTFAVAQNFCLQTMFEEWSSEEGGGFASILFQDSLSKKDARKLLSRWKINFSVNDALQGLSEKEKKREQAVDEGGPEAQFFSMIWQMTPSLKASTPDGSKSIALFEKTEGGFVPIPDDIFNNLDSPEIVRQAKLYYRALGRLLLNCLSMTRPVPDEVLPMLFRNAIIRDCMPTSPDYCGDALCDHLIEIGWSKGSIDYQKKELLSEEKFRKDIHCRYIKERQIWFESFNAGVTVEDHLPISFFFGLMPLEAVNRLAFATQKFSAEDVIATLGVQYSKDEILPETQKKLFEDVLKPILRDWANEDSGTGRSRLHRFVEFCSGQSYLPHPSQKFKITVVFEAEHEDSYPAAYTCVNELHLPSQAYDANREKFEAKLEYSVGHSDKFLMN